MSLSLGFFVILSTVSRSKSFLFLLAAVILLTGGPLRDKSEGAIRLISQDQSGLVFEFLAGEATVEELPGQADERDFQLLRLSGCDVSIEEGAPMLPTKAVAIGLPPEGSATWTVLEDEFIEWHDLLLAPGPRVFRTGTGASSYYQTVHQPDGQLYMTDAYLPETVCTAHPDLWLRDQRILPLVLFPVQFNPVARTVRIHRRLVVHVRFDSNAGVFQDQPRKDLFEEVYRTALLNYDQAKPWRSRPIARARGALLDDDPFSMSDDWLKISLRNEGLCRLTSGQLEAAGIDIAGVDPATVKIYHMGRKILPRQVGLAPTMKEIPSLVTGQEDGQLDPGDEILFYATDLSGWEEMSQAGYEEYANPYTDINVYWLTYGGVAGKRMEYRTGSPQSSTYYQAERFQATVHGERDFLNPSYSGLTWYWDSMTEHGVETAQHRVTVAGVSEPSYRLKVRVKGISYKPSGSIPPSIPHHVYFYLNEGTLPIIERLWYGAVAIEAEGEGDGLREGENIVRIVLPRVESEWDHILFDWFEIRYWRNYQTADDQLHFSSPDSSGIIQYDLEGFNASSIIALDVSDPYWPVQIQGGTVFPVSNHYTLRFQDEVSPEQSKRYYVASPQAYVSPVSIQRRIPEDLREVNADLIVVTPGAWRGNVEPLVSLHRAEGLRVMAVDIQDIYDQFAWGLMDPTAIRDFLWFAYHQGQPPAPAYVILFGDGNFDYRNNSGAGGNDWIPPYEIGDVCTDDWFVRLDGDLMADMMIGRLPVRSQEEADVVVGKIVDYVRQPLFGPWRNRILIASDDETAEGGEGNELFHARDSEDLARNFIPSSYDQHKVYLMEYPMNWSNKKPEAQQAVIDGFNQGMLVVNWIGHGNFDVWAHEDAFRGSNDIPKLTNQRQLPLVYAASCDVGRFDHTLNESMAEELLRARGGGAVASIAATRYCFATPNAALNKEVLRLVLDAGNPTLGEGLFGAKLSRPNSYSNDQKYLLLGDPCMRLGRPIREGRITAMSCDTLRALDRVSLQGQVYLHGVPDTAFGGTISLQVFDSARPTTYLTQVGSSVKYLLPGAALFRGPTVVDDGLFQATFVVPKDITYGGRMARISGYFNDQSQDGLAYRDSLPVQGTVTAVNDTIGPSIELRIAGQDISSGDFVSSRPTVIVHLEDDNGINITGEVGHWIILSVDDVERINVTERFNYDPGSFQRGMLEYTLEKLEEGQHEVALKAWDNFNNFSTTSLAFEVVEERKLILRDVLNCPNPFDPSVEGTQFTYQLSRPARVTIKLYTVAGRLIRTLEQGEVLQGYHESDPWDGVDQDGDPVANGVYLYKVIARAQGKQAEAYGKVVVMR